METVEGLYLSDKKIKVKSSSLFSTKVLSAERLKQKQYSQKSNLNIEKR